MVMTQSKFIAADESVQYFLEKIWTQETSPRRSRKIVEIQRDKAIYNAIIRRTENMQEAEIKSSLPHKLFRAYEIQADHLPHTIPDDDTGESQVVLNMVESVKDVLYADANMDSILLDIIQNGSRTDGTIPVQIGFNDDGDFVSVRTIEFANFYTDYDKDKLAEDSSDENPRYARWCAVKVGMNRKQFNGAFPDFADKVEAGDPTIDTVVGATNATVNNKQTHKDEIFVVYAYSLENKGKYVVFAGAKADLLLKEEGADYKYKYKKLNGKEYCFLPFGIFRQSTLGEGICAMSQVGLLADLARIDQDITTTAMPVITRAVNQILAVFSADSGTSGGAMKKQLDQAWKLQRMGRPSLMTFDAEAKIQSIAPDAGIINSFQAARDLIYRMAGDRFGVNFFDLANTEEKSTIFIGKTKAEMQAINAWFRINRKEFDGLAKKMVALSAKYWKKDNRKIAVLLDEGTGDTTTLDLRTALDSIKEWGGRFKTDVDLKMPLSTSEKNDVLVGLSIEKNNIKYQIPWESPEEINTDIDTLIARARISGVEDYFRKADIMKEIMIIYNRKMGGLQTGEGQPEDVEMMGEGLNPANEEVARELSPNKFLAEAGL